MTKRVWLCCGLVALAIGLLENIPARAQAVSVPNPSFEQGTDTPSDWTLSGGNGEWITGAAEGQRAIAVTGSGQSGDSNYWRSQNLPLAPFGIYQLRFQARRISGSGGCPISGPVFCNQDLFDLTDSWKPYTSVFLTPGDPNPEDLWLRFGQWEVNGTVAFDAIELTPAQAVYRTVNGITLGEGERLDGSAYTFEAPLKDRSANQSRPLAALNCGFNTGRFVFGAGSEVTYRHTIDHQQQTSANVSVVVGNHAAGELAVEVSTDGTAWRELGVLGGLGSGDFAVPADALPSGSVYIRLRCQTGPNTEFAALQVHGYTYCATLESAPGDFQGATAFVAASETDPRCDVVFEGLGEGVPGGENVLSSRILNKSRETLDVRPELTLSLASGESWKAVGDPATVPAWDGSTAADGSPDYPSTPFALNYEMRGTGTVRAALTLGDTLRYRAETEFNVSPLFDSSFGETLPVSSEKVGVWWAASGWKISRPRPVPEKQGGAIRIQAARNEAEAAQLVVRPAELLRGFLAASAALTGPGGAVIPAENVDVLRVRYVPVTRPTDVVGVAAPWPDPLPPFSGPIDVPANQNQPVWVRIRVPRDTPPGTYTGVVHLTAEGFRADAPLELTVFDFDLPKRMTCTTAFGFSPERAFRYHNVTEAEQQREVLDKYLEALGAHHISPYNPAPLDPFGVTWTNTGGAAPAPQFDWTAWDAAMTRAFNEYGFNSFSIPIVGMGGGTFHSRTEPSLLGHAENTPEYQAAFKAYCQGVETHLREKGWLDYAFVYWFDEPDPKDYEFVMNGFRKLKDNAPGIHRMLTEQVEPALVGGPDIWCPLTPSFDPEAAQERRAAGDHFWWYICTGPKAPYVTLFIDHPGTELRVWLWQTWQRRIDGILIWETNYWTSETAYPDPAHPQNPYADPMGWTVGYGTPAGARLPWGNGDGRFIYPPEAAAGGRPAQPVLDPPVDSVRLEMLRDGLEDYEYMVLLERLIEKHRNVLSEADYKRHAALLEVPESISTDLTHFTTDPAPIEAHRGAVARAIEELSRR